jgi:hypothetical protein
MRGASNQYPDRGFTPKGKMDVKREREWRTTARHPHRINDTDELLPPGSAGHKGRDSPKRSANERQLESHGAVLSDVDSSWAQD